MKSILMGILVAGIMIPYASHAKKIKFMPSATAPAAKGYVKVKTDNNNNHVIKIDIRALADIDRLQTKVTYVVWMETDQGRVENLGQLNSSSGFMSKQMKATLETVSSYKPTKIFVTAEEFAKPQFPSEQIILTTDRF